MEYVPDPCPTLEEYVRQRGPGLGSDEIVALGRQLLGVLAHLYAHKVVHGDIKLNNFLVQQRLLEAAAEAPKFPRLVLIDFGCAVMRGEGPADMNRKFEVHVAEATNFALGSSSHQAPEVVAALALKRRLRRGSDERVVVPLGGQDAFAAGVAMCVCLSHSVSPSPSLCSSSTRGGRLREGGANTVNDAGLAC
jgi:serine/threonine protein kinase